MAAQFQMQPPVQVVNTAASYGGWPSVTSLYVGDLEGDVTGYQLYNLFSRMGYVVSVRVCRDFSSGGSLGYGYVNYSNPQDAERALAELNFTPLNGKPIRIMYSRRDPSIRKSGTGNIFIKNLDKGIDHKALHDTFSSFGNIFSCKVATNSSGQSLGYGFVQYASEESARKAIEKLNGMLLNGKQVYVGPFVRKQERVMSVDKSKFTNVFVKNLSESMKEEDLQKAFGEFGSVTSVAVMRYEDGTSKCFGFVNFENPDDACRAVESLNGKKVDNKEWYVGRAQKKSEREMELKKCFKQCVKEAEGSNLYVKNLDNRISDDMLKDLFSPFGSITSCKVLRDSEGISRGSGFVAFSSPEEAGRALSEMNGKMIGNVKKPLYIALAQRKEDRRARLQVQFAEMKPMTMPPTVVAPRLPMHAHAGPGLGQQIFYGQRPAAAIIPPPPGFGFPQQLPPQPGFGYEQQVVPGMWRPSGPLMPNTFVAQPMVPQGQRSANSVPIMQQSVDVVEQQMLPWGRGYQYPPQVPMQGGEAGGMLSVTYDMDGGMPLSLPIPIAASAPALANASPDEQRTVLGENLYPAVEQLESETPAN